MAHIEVTEEVEGGSRPRKITLQGEDEVLLSNEAEHFYFHLQATNKGDREAALKVSCEWEPTDHQVYWLFPQVRRKANGKVLN